MGNSRMSLIILEGSKEYEASELVETLTWKGRFGSAARSIAATLVDDSGYQHARTGINVEEGHQCYFAWDGTELFRGIIMRQEQTDKKKMKITAYDNAIYLSNNKDSWQYTNKRAHEVFKDVCNRFGLPMGDVASCSYCIPEITESKKTGFDTIADALSEDYDATGIRHYVLSQNGKLSLLTRRQNILQWVIETGQNITGYTYTRSIEDVKTRIKMISKEGTVLAERSNSSLESKIGVMQDIQTPDEDMTTAQINDLIASVLKSSSMPSRSLSVNAIGIPDVISGIGVYIIIPELGLEKTFYVDDDTHTFEGNEHTMDLTLTAAEDLDAEEIDSGSSNTSFSVGDIVTFNGGYHYYGSNYTNPVGGYRNGGQAELTLIAQGAKHPYHLIGGLYNGKVSGSCNVYGWVDAGTFTK